MHNSEHYIISRIIKSIDRSKIKITPHIQKEQLKILIFNKTKLNTMDLDVLQQRAELVQEVIDRQIYLKPDEKERYIREIKALNDRFQIKKRIVHGMHIIER